MCRSLRRTGGASVSTQGGIGLLNRNQRAAARQLLPAAYLLSSDGRAKDEVSTRESLPPYAGIHAASLAEHDDRERVDDALRKQLHRDVSVEPEKMRLIYVFTHDGSIVAVDSGEGFLKRAERWVLDAQERIRAGSFEPIHSRYGCSHCPVMGVGITGCPTEVPEE